MDEQRSRRLADQGLKALGMRETADPAGRISGDDLEGKRSAVTRAIQNNSSRHRFLWLIPT